MSGGTGDRIQTLHHGFAGLNLAMAFAGLAYGSDPIDLNVIFLAVLFMLMRAKFWWDDDAYFADVNNGKLPGGLPFGFGFVVAVLSWIAWGFAGFYVRSIQLSSGIMAVVFALSTSWIVAAMVKRGAYEEQVPWLFFNVVYALGFSLIAFRSQGWNPFASHPGHFSTAVLAVILILFFLDLGVTRILEQKRRKLQPLPLVAPPPPPPRKQR